MEDDKFRLFCVDQIKRLGVFNPFQFMNSEGRKEFRKFFEARTRDEAKVAVVIDEAVKLESIPTLFELRAIWNGLFPPQDFNPETTDEERTARRAYLRNWYAAEEHAAKDRRAEFLANSKSQLPQITDADIRKLREIQESNQKRIAAAAELLS